EIQRLEGEAGLMQVVIENHEAAMEPLQVLLELSQGQVAALQEDKARLDYLGTEEYYRFWTISFLGSGYQLWKWCDIKKDFHTPSGQYPTFNDAIDAAKEKGNE
ncbi:hypothetical protein LCGC14_3043640, partial [marine sediment metagenome]